MRPIQLLKMETVKSPYLRLEILNSLLHALGIVFGIISVPVLIAEATKNNNLAGITGAGIYGVCFLMLFTCSTLYHGFQQPKLKELLRILDHISIYFLIAGTYTPIILVFVNNPFGMRLLVALWTLTALGIVFKTFFTGRFEITSTFIYMLMGWILFIDPKNFFAVMPQSVIALIIVGGVLYSIGVVFFLWEKYIYHHAIWHTLVLAAAICHYAAVFIAVSHGAG